jgi:hypothetical protein
MPDSGLDSLILKIPRDVLLGVQGLLVLPDELVLFIWKPEKQRLTKTQTDETRRDKSTKKGKDTLECGNLDLEGLNGGFRDSCYAKNL